MTYIILIEIFRNEIEVTKALQIYFNGLLPGLHKELFTLELLFCTATFP